MLITAALHHPPIWWWCWAALGLWVGERLWRATWWVYTNGIVVNLFVGRNRNKTGFSTSANVGSLKDKQRGSNPRHVANGSLEKPFLPGYHPPAEAWEMGMMSSKSLSMRDASSKSDASAIPQSYSLRYTPRPSSPESPETQESPTDGQSMYSNAEAGETSGTIVAPIPRAATPGSASFSASMSSRTPLHHLVGRASSSHLPLAGDTVLPSQYVPPPGFAHATLLPGRTVRLRLITPGYVTWAPGQHFLIGIPSVSRFGTHPFSVASVCDEQAAVRVQGKAADDDEDNGGRNEFARAEAGREMVLLIRAKKGWTRRLWELIFALQARGESVAPGESLPPGHSPPPRVSGAPHAGVLLRTLVDGPFGSSVRARWGAYSSILIVAGGSGVSFGLSIFEYVCLCMAGRDGQFLGGRRGGWGMPGWKSQRVRFVWLVREYAHIQWCASALRRCMKILPTDALEVNIFVTNYKPSKEIYMPKSAFSRSDDGIDGLLAPPAPRFAKKPRPRSVESEDSVASDSSLNSLVDMYYGVDEYTGSGTPEFRSRRGGGDDSELGHETSVLDYTNFDGDNDTPLPGENQLSRKVKKESRLRRAKTRRAAKAVMAKQELEERATQGHPRMTMESTTSPTDPASGHFRFSITSADPLMSPQATSPSGVNAISPTSPPEHALPHSLSKLSYDQSPPQLFSPKTPTPHRPRPDSMLSNQSASTFDMRSPQLGGGGAESARWREPLGEQAEASGLTLDAQEMHDLRVISELALAGKPKLDRILANEVDRAKGRIVVAC